MLDTMDNGADYTGFDLHVSANLYNFREKPNIK